MTNLRIIIDTNEQLAYSFHNINPRPILIYKKLKTGDYSLEGFESEITIERKTLGDLFGSTGTGRERFEREFIRMQDFSYAAVVIESGLDDIFINPPEHSSMSRKSVFRTLISWSIRYNVHIWPCPDRNFAERLTYLILKRWYELKMMEI